MRGQSSPAGGATDLPQHLAGGRRPWRQYATSRFQRWGWCQSLLLSPKEWGADSLFQPHSKAHRLDGTLKGGCPRIPKSHTA